MATKKCTKQLALTVEKNVMFLSNQTVAGQFTAENVTPNADHHAQDTKRNLRNFWLKVTASSFSFI
jgi:hypothetical protein